jgi:hypothetical protein
LAEALRELCKVLDLHSSAAASLSPRETQMRNYYCIGLELSKSEVFSSLNSLSQEPVACEKNFSSSLPLLRMQMLIYFPKTWMSFSGHISDSLVRFAILQPFCFSDLPFDLRTQRSQLYFKSTPFKEMVDSYRDFTFNLGNISYQNYFLKCVLKCASFSDASTSVSWHPELFRILSKGSFFCQFASPVNDFTARGKPFRNYAEKYLTKFRDSSVSFSSCNDGVFDRHHANINIGSLCSLMKDLSALTNLTSLNLTLCRRITDAGLAYLGALGKSLTSLNLSDCQLITNAGLAHLRALGKSLTSLKLSNCHEITDAGLAYLSKLPNLTNLNLKFCREITDSGLAHLHKLTNLTTLNLMYCLKITQRGLFPVNFVKKLYTSVNVELV